MIGLKGELEEAVNRRFADIVHTASELIRIPSRNPPGEERRCAEYIHARLKEYGLETHLVREPFENRPQVVALRRGKGNKTIMLNGHIDTVPEGNVEDWSVDPFSGQVKDGYLYGRGAADMKSALAMMIHIAEIAKPDVNVLLTFAVGEERAEPGTPALISYCRRFGLDVKYGIVMEPTSMDVAHCQKGAAWFRIKLSGKPAHASLPGEGINAISLAARAMHAIDDYGNDLVRRKHRLGVTPTCAVTMISGGYKENVIPDKCDLVVDRRLVPGESSNMAESEMRTLMAGLDIGYALERIGSREAVEIDENSAVVRAVIDATSEATGKSTKICFPGATDNEHLVAAGIDSVVWGPGDLGRAHTVDECIGVDEIRRATLALAVLLNKLV